MLRVSSLPEMKEYFSCLVLENPEATSLVEAKFKVLHLQLKKFEDFKTNEFLGKFNLLQLEEQLKVLFFLSLPLLLRNPRIT